MSIGRRVGWLVGAGALPVAAVLIVVLGGPTDLALAPATIPAERIVAGGPGKDGIPALVSPAVVTAGAAAHLGPDDRVLGLTFGGVARAYPIAMLNWHELVNDELGGRSVLVTYCPLCGSGAAFDRRVGDTTLEFGVSGLLYESNVLMYDRTDGGLWSQLARAAVTGPRAGTRLRALPLVLTTWQAWRTAHPATTVLAADTGYRRDYAHDPYAGYADTPALMFPVTRRDARREPKEWIVGVVLDGVAKAYPFRELARMGGPLQDRLGGRTLVLTYDAASRTAVVRTKDGAAVPATYAFWFAWAVFHPTTDVFVHDDGERPIGASGDDGLFPLAVGQWWVYEERSAAGEVSAIERWQVRAGEAGRFVVRTRQRRHDGRVDEAGAPRWELIAREERFELRPDGIVRSREGAGTDEAYLLRTPIAKGRTWQDAGGRCRVVAVDASVAAAGQRFDRCTRVACAQGDMVRVLSSYAPGVGLVRQEVAFGGFGPFDMSTAHGGRSDGSARGASAILVLRAWGTRAPGDEG